MAWSREAHIVRRQRPFVASDLHRMPVAAQLGSPPLLSRRSCCQPAIALEARDLFAGWCLLVRGRLSRHLGGCLAVWTSSGRRVPRTRSTTRITAGPAASAAHRDTPPHRCFRAIQVQRTRLEALLQNPPLKLGNVPRGDRAPSSSVSSGSCRHSPLHALEPRPRSATENLNETGVRFWTDCSARAEHRGDSGRRLTHCVTRRTLRPQSCPVG